MKTFTLVSLLYTTVKKRKNNNNNNNNRRKIWGKQKRQWNEWKKEKYFENAL